MGHGAVVLGASGYSGGELIRLLSAHPAFELLVGAANSRAGEALGEVHPHLAHLDVTLAEARTAAATPADVCFSCLPAGELDALGTINAEVVIDLADDHRADRSWVYGLTEFARDQLAGATRVANPGCYPTAALLGLIPFARAGVIQNPVVVDALSGVSGAGRRGEDRLLFASLDGSAAAYGTVDHRHVPEMERYLDLFGDAALSVSFTPHLIPVARGLLVTARAKLASSLSDTAATSILHDVYSEEPFVHVVEGWAATKAVAGSNAAHVSARVDARNDWLVCSVAIDNLGKGAAGQALQNANVIFGLEETTGLAAGGVWP